MNPVASAIDRMSSLVALSSALDMANGLPEDKSLLTATFAHHLAQALDFDDTVCQDAFLAGLLRHLGCTAFAAQESRLAQDDIALRRSLLLHNGATTAEVLGALVKANPNWEERLRAMWTLVQHQSDLRANWTAQACDAGRVLAQSLGCPPSVAQAMVEIYEHWDGRGQPRAKVGVGISDVGRINQVAHTAILIWLSSGTAAAQAYLLADGDTFLDGQIAQAAADLLPVLDEAEFADDWAVRLGSHNLAHTTVQQMAQVFGEFADLQSPFTLGHSASVLRLSQAMAQAMGLAGASRCALAAAASLHDLGQVALPTSLWLARTPWRAAQRTQGRLHAVHTRRILESSKSLHLVAELAGHHHENAALCLKNLAEHGADAQQAALILACAEMACGLGQARPHRGAHDTPAVAQYLRQAAHSGTLEPAVVECCIGCLGLPMQAAATSPHALSERELQVLRALALGASNKVIARQLGISDRTVQSHTVHIYQKLGVSTRAAAALLASRHGWIS